MEKSILKRFAKRISQRYYSNDTFVFEFKATVRREKIVMQSFITVLDFEELGELNFITDSQEYKDSMVGLMETVLNEFKAEGINHIELYNKIIPIAGIFLKV